MAKIELGKIIPRWEWRTFGEDFGVAEENIKAHECTRAIESSEVYILSKNSGENIKVRDTLMDIKVLREVNADTLEQWFPIMKATFPIAKGEMEEVFKAAKVDFDGADAQKMDFDEFIAKYVDSNPNLKSVGVFKKRFGYMIEGATVEIADLTIDGKAIRTTAVEDADPELVISLVKKLGLIDFENISYIKAMRRMVGFEE
jgi:exopolyphosphatase/guanosine-5'-triphosphate,3'-diphosphate pyrophosphatase